MTLTELNLSSGKWLVANCGKFPSEKNCKLVLMAPETQKSDLVKAAAQHAASVHGHPENQDLLREIENSFEKIIV